MQATTQPSAELINQIAAQAATQAATQASTQAATQAATQATTQIAAATQRATTKPIFEGAAPAEQALEAIKKLGFDDTIENTPYQNWIWLLLFVTVGVVIGKTLSYLLEALSKWLEKRGLPIRATIAHSFAGPLNLSLITADIAGGLSFIELSPKLYTFSFATVQLLSVISTAWLFLNLIEVIAILINRASHSLGAGAIQSQLAPLARRALRIGILVIFVLFTFQNVFKLEVGPFIAGLGIAGLAFSLAAQDSIKNLFGSVTIFADKPFGIGDNINLYGVEGSVEKIGFRSTRIRTVKGAIVTIPNSKIIDNSVENVSRRGNIRRDIDLGLTYDATPDQMDAAVEKLRAVMTDPVIAYAFNLEKNPPRVHFTDLKTDNLNIHITYWFHPATDWWAYQDHAQKVNLRLMREVSALGLQFAFPTQTMIVQNAPLPTGESPRRNS